jgi:hypothetical protein
MAAGAVPLVVGKGGQKEIMEDLPFLMWETQSECVDKTKELLQKQNKLEEYKNKVITRAADFNKDSFMQRVTTLFTL